MPSLRFIKVSDFGGMRNSMTEYLQGRNWRHESRECRGFCDGDPHQPGAIRYEYGPQRAVIHNQDLHYSFHLDLESRVYTATRIVDYAARRRVFGAARRPPSSGRTIRIHGQTHDTGERRSIFGYAARRVIIRTTQTIEPGETQPAVTEVDGWFIDPPAAWLELHPPSRGRAFLAVGSSDGKLDAPVFTDEGPRENGLALLMTRTHRSTHLALGELREHVSVDREEVTEISEDELDPDLFTPPPAFRRVKRLPGDRRVPLAMRIRLRWHSVKRSLALR